MGEDKKRPGNQKTGFKAWWKKNRKTVLLIGGGVLLAVGGIAIYKNWDKILKLISAGLSVEKAVARASDMVEEVVDATAVSPGAVSKVLNNGEPFNVSRHIRNLSDGRKASPRKVAEAAQYGIALMDGQTWVDAYFKNTA